MESQKLNIGQIRMPVLISLSTLFIYPFLTLVLELTGITYGHLYFDYINTYYPAAQRVLNGGDMYLPVTDAPGPNPYNYPPLVILIFLPFGLFPKDISAFLWVVFSFIILSSGTIYLLKSVGLSLNIYQKIISSILIIGYAPMLISLVRFSQVVPLMTGMVCYAAGTIVNSKSKHNTIANGFAEGLTVAVSYIKIMYAPINAYALRDVKRLKNIALAGFLLLVFGVFFFGFDLHVEWVVSRIIKDTYIYDTPSDPSNWTTSTFKPLYFFQPYTNVIRSLLIIFVALVSVFASIDNNKLAEIRTFCLGIVVLPLAAPTSGSRVIMLSILMPAYILLFLYESNEDKSYETFIAISLFLVQIHPYAIGFLSSYGPRRFSVLDSVTGWIPIIQPALWGCLILFIISFYRCYEHVNISVFS